MYVDLLHRFRISSALILSAAILPACGDYGDDDGPEATVVAASGDVTAARDQFRLLLGDPSNGGTAGQQPAGRREVNWDGVPAAVTNNDAFPARFFNSNSTRGLVTTPLGTGLRVSDLDMSDVNPSYAAQFDAFTQKKTFAVSGGTAMDVTFEVAGEATVAAVKGFGVVFSDVDVAGSASIELYGEDGDSLGRFDAPVRSGGTSFSFLGAAFDEPIVTRVRIVSGQAALSADIDDVTDGGTSDLVVMDDFFYGEPTAIQ
jgi:hypothetical protein